MISSNVRSILQEVRARGDKALVEFTRRFDKIILKGGLRVQGARVRKAYRNIDPSLRQTLEESARRIRRFHSEERRQLARSWHLPDGIGQRMGPVESVGIYVPGGRFAYPSTVLMTALPARTAGVKRVVMVTPPRHLEDAVLAAAHIAGVDEVYRVGGPAAIGALAYGTRQIPAVDLIVGPGNAHVTEAKRQVFGTVGIDSLAGASELVVIADSSANAVSIALDLEAQTEHDPAAQGVLISLDPELLENVRRNVDSRLLARCEFLKANSPAQAAKLSNERAPEHLEIWTKRPQALLKHVRHAGAVFLGPWSPAVVGDYWAGSSHVLPTARAARFSSGLSVLTFMKRTNIIQLSPFTFLRAAGPSMTLARTEGLTFHERSVKVRTL